MHKIYTAGASATPPTVPVSMPNPGYYPSASCIFDPYTAYAITQEIINVIEDTGATLDVNSVNQLLTAINYKINQAAIANAFPKGYRGSAPPSYISNTQFSVASIADRDSTNTANMSKDTATTVDVSTTGLNGIAQSANLTGTVSVTSGSATLTFSTSQDGVLQVGGVVTTAGGQSRRLISGAGTSWTAESNFGTTESGVTFKRGGRAPNTFLNLYTIAQAGGANPGFILTTRNVSAGDTLVDLPSGYTLSSQQAFAVLLDSSGNIIPFRVADGWPRRPIILIPQQSVLSNGQATSLTTVPLSSYVPPISRLAVMFNEVRPLIDIQGVSGSFSLYEDGASSAWYTWNYSASGNAPSAVETVPVSSSQAVAYITTTAQAGAWAAYLNVRGFVVTEVK